MAISADVHVNEQFLKILPPLTITTAIGATATTPVTNLGGMKYVAVECKFVYGSGGTTVDVYIQTSLDGGLTWIDIMEFDFTTASANKVNSVTIAPSVVTNFPPVSVVDGSLAINTSVQGVLGDRLRAKYITVGTYGGSTSLAIYATVKG